MTYQTAAAAAAALTPLLQTHCYVTYPVVLTLQVAPGVLPGAHIYACLQLVNLYHLQVDVRLSGSGCHRVCKLQGYVGLEGPSCDIMLPFPRGWISPGSDTFRKHHTRHVHCTQWDAEGFDMATVAHMSWIALVQHQL